MLRRTALPITVVAVAAFAAGGVIAPAGASAAKLTKKKVEQIAAAVVDQKAPSLTVARAASAGKADSATTAVSAQTAASAGDSAKLGGQPPSAFQGRTWVVTSVSLGTSANRAHRWTLNDVPPGSYLMRYDLHFDRQSASGPISCDVTFSNGQNIEPLIATGSSLTNDVTGGGLVAFSGNRKVRLACGVPEGKIAVKQPKWEQSSITLTEVEGTAAVSGVTVENQD